MFLHDDLDDLNDDLSVIPCQDVDFLFFDDKLRNDNLVLKLLILSAAG